MAIEQSINAMARVTAGHCHRDLDLLALDPGPEERARLERRLVERLPFAALETFLAKRLAVSGTDEMIAAARENIAWNRSFLAHLTSGEGRCILEFGLPLACLPLERLALLISIGLKIEEHSEEILFYARQNGDAARLTFLLERAGWRSFRKWSSFASMIRDCTPELAAPLADFLNGHPDPTRHPALRCLGSHGEQIDFNQASCKGVLLAWHVDPEGLARTQAASYARNAPAARLRERLLASHHARFPILAEAPDIPRALSLSEEEAVALAKG